MEFMNAVALTTILALAVGATVLLVVYILRVLDYLLFPITKYTGMTSSYSAPDWFSGVMFLGACGILLALIAIPIAVFASLVNFVRQFG